MSFTPASRAPIIWCPPRVGQAFNWNHAAAWGSNNWLAETVGAGCTLARDTTVSKYGYGSGKNVMIAARTNSALCRLTAGGSADLTVLKQQLETALALDVTHYVWVLVPAASGGSVDILVQMEIFKNAGATSLAFASTDYGVGEPQGVAVSASTWYLCRVSCALGSVSAADRALIDQIDLRVIVETGLGATATVHFDGSHIGRVWDFCDYGPKQAAQIMSAFPERAVTAGMIEDIPNGYVEHQPFSTMREGPVEVGPFDQTATDAAESYRFNVIGAKQPFEIWSDRTLEDRHGMARCVDRGGSFNLRRERDYRIGKLSLQEIP